MRALKYFVSEAAASLWRGRRSAVLAILTIGAGLFVLGFFLILNTNVRRSGSAARRPCTVAMAMSMPYWL